MFVEEHLSNIAETVIEWTQFENSENWCTRLNQAFEMSVVSETYL